MSTIISYISGHKTEFCVSALISSIFSIALFLIYHLVILFQGGPLILDYGMVPIVLSLLFTLVSTFSFFQLASLFAKKKGGSITMAIIGPFQFSLRKAVYVVICIIGIIGIITSQYVQFWTGLTGLPLSDNVLMAYIPNPIQFLNNTILLYYTYPVSKYPEISNSVILQGKQKFLQTNGSKWIVQFDQFGFVSDAIEPIQTSSYIFSDAEQQQWTEFLKRNASFFGINPSTFTIESQTNNKNNSIIEGQQIVVISASGGGESGLPLVDLSSLPITIDVIKTTTSIEIKGHFWPNASLAGHDVPIISKSQVVQEFLKKPYTYTYLIPGVCNLMCSRTNPNCCDTIPKQQKLRTTRLSQNNITISGLLVLIDTNDGWNATIRLAYRVLVGGYDGNTYLDGKVISSPVIPMKTYMIDANTGEILYSS